MSTAIVAMTVIALICSRAVFAKEPPKPKPADQELGEAFAKVLKALKDK